MDSPKEQHKVGKSMAKPVIKKKKKKKRETDRQMLEKASPTYMWCRQERGIGER